MAILKSTEGIHQDGAAELSETPPELPSGRVTLKRLTKRSLIRRVTAVAIAIILCWFVFINPHVRYVPLGWLGGEKFFHGLPTSHWRRDLKNEYSRRRSRDSGPFREFLEWVKQTTFNYRSEILETSDPGALPVLADLLYDEDFEVRWMALETVNRLSLVWRFDLSHSASRNGRSQLQEIIPHLRYVLEHEENPQMRLQAACTLNGIDPNATASVLPVVIELLSHSDSYVRLSAAATLSPGKYGFVIRRHFDRHPEMYVFGYQISRSPRDWYRKPPGGTFGYIAGGATALPVLIGALRDADEHVRITAIYALGGIGPEAKEATPDLSNMLMNPSWGVRREAIDALIQIHPKAASMLSMLSWLNDFFGAALEQYRVFALLASEYEPVPIQSRRPDDAKPLKLPDWWNAKDPLPIVKSNCVRCHLTAGRELTAPLREFARSVHDLSNLSCADCHGGNTKEDAKAHEAEFHFIGTKLSAHILACTECHKSETEGFRKGKHYWDVTKRLNRDLPTCVDCHGNHDVGKPPANFSMTNVCTDCHKKFDKDQHNVSTVVTEHDELWKVLRRVHAKNVKAEDPTPEAFQRKLKRVRTGTARLVHRAGPVTAEEAQALNKQMQELRQNLEAWLKEHK